MRVIMLAPPGAGKGTQGERIAGRYGVPHIASGDIFRDEVARATPLGKQIKGYLDAGDLVPDDLVTSMILDRVLAAVRDTGGYVLDGFPRTLEQAKSAAEIASEKDASAQAVLYLDAPAAVLVQRATGRGEGRADDSEAVAKHRLEVYTEHTRPLIDYYESRGLLVKIDAAPPIEDVSREIFAALDQVSAAR